jgi:hypothetical protein
MTELIWDGKYDKDGRRVARLRIALPFQTVETVNESARERQRTPRPFGGGAWCSDAASARVAVDHSPRRGLMKDEHFRIERERDAEATEEIQAEQPVGPDEQGHVVDEGLQATYDTRPDLQLLETDDRHGRALANAGQAL